ncbi:MAG: glycosyltransferase family 2 protein, partial [Lachnospiraceae bacterium]|nr:glycosyltransferase family 2 protein [Lachnospiraceae bacterium]
RALYDRMEECPEAFSASASMRMWDQPELLDGAGDNYCALGWAYARGKGRPAVKYKKPCEIFSSCGGAVIYRRDILRQIGLFDELHFAYLEDLDLGYRARIHGYVNVYAPEAEVIHYGSGSTGSRYNEWKTEKASANSVYVVWKNMPLLQWLWNLPLLLLGFLVKFIFFTGKGMGKIYIKGLWKGLKRCCHAEGRAHKVHFQFCHLGNYLWIQILLYINLFRFLLKR